MKKKLFVIIALLLACACCVAWYFMKDRDDARQLLPEDATSVLVFEPLELLDGLGLGASDLDIVPTDVKNLIESVDLTKPIYVFDTRTSGRGVCLCLRDADKFMDSGAALGFTSERNGESKWMTGRNSICLTDGRKALLMITPQPDSDAIRPAMQKLMTQGKREAPLLRSLGDKGFLRLTTTLDKLPAEFRRTLPAGFDPTQARLNASWSIGSKNITLSAELQTPEPLLGDEFLRPVKGNLSDLAPAQPFLSFCINISGEKLIELIRKQPELRTALLGLNMMLDADMMLSAIDGDVSIVVPTPSLGKPDVLITATLKDTDFLQNANDWDKVRKLSSTDFVASYEGIDTYFGVRNGLLYVTTSQELAECACEKSYASMPLLKGKRMSAFINVGQIIKAYPPLRMALIAMPQLGEALNAIDGVAFSADTPQSLEVSVTTEKPVKDIVKNLKTLLKGK